VPVIGHTFNISVAGLYSVAASTTFVHSVVLFNDAVSSELYRESACICIASNDIG
jgi:hypothetical protein